MNRTFRIGIGCVVFLTIFAVVIVTIQKTAHKRPVELDTAIYSEFESVLEKFVAESLTRRYEPSTVTTEASTAKAPETTTAERATERITAAPIETTTEVDVEEVYDYHGDYIGTFELTAYEWTGYPMANGEYPYYGACASNYFALGTVLYIEGYGTFVVKDRGGMADNVIDIYLGDADACIEFGRRTAEVYYG